MNERNLSFDLLRAIGLLCIILAHVKPPEFLFQLRSFDVVMMVCISTLSYTEYAKPKPYIQYLKSRLKRLLIPAWEYIIILGLVFCIIAKITDTPNPFPIKTLLIGILTMSSVGYLWIIRVFLYNAFINPIIPKLQTMRRGGVILCLSAIYATYAFLRHFCMNSRIPHLATLAEASILDFLAYGLIAVAAYILYHQKTKWLILSTVIVGIGLLASMMDYGSFAPNTFKYPPETQYFFWGLFVVGLSFLLCRWFSIYKIPRFVTFISANSMWVYFWHLIPVNFIKHYSEFIPSEIGDSWWIKWIVIVLFASGATYIQNIFSKKSKDILEKIDLKLITK